MVRAAGGGANRGERWTMAGQHEVEKRSYDEGQFIFREREVGDMAFVVAAGKIEIVKQVEGGEYSVLGVVGQGGMFGEMALIDDKPRMASARSCVDGTTVIIVSRQMFDKKLASSDPFIRGLLNILADHVRRMSR